MDPLPPARVGENEGWPKETLMGVPEPPPPVCAWPRVARSSKHPPRGQGDPPWRTAHAPRS